MRETTKEGTIMNNKVLVIEDDPATSRLVDYSLRHHGYEVIVATNGLEGVRKARTELPDLVILDVMLPGIDGYEICHRLRADPATSKICILMFSAKAQEIDKDTGKKVGADDYLVKPAAPAEIIDRVERLLAKKGSPPQVKSTLQEKVSGKG
jgi:DNA-binding response OmpR family regulator